MCCISFESYIKPQLAIEVPNAWGVVYLLNPTSNHNYILGGFFLGWVVYLLNPTSNHNSHKSPPITPTLYIF